MTIDPIISGSGLVVMGIIGYFLRRIHVQVDDNSKALISFRVEVNEKFDKIETKILAAFQAMCHERQDKCGQLRDAKLEKVELTCKAQCNKIHAMIDDRNKKWERQEVINDTIKTHMASNHAK